MCPHKSQKDEEKRRNRKEKVRMSLTLPSRELADHQSIEISYLCCRPAATLPWETRLVRFVADNGDHFILCAFFEEGEEGVRYCY